MSNTNSESFIITIDNNKKTIHLIEFDDTGNFKRLTFSENLNESFLGSSLALLSKKVSKLFDANDDLGGLDIDDEHVLIDTIKHDLSCMIPGVRYLDEKNVIIEQSPKYLLSNGDVVKACLQNESDIVAYIPWHLLHINIIEHAEINVYLANNKIVSLEDQVYANTLVNKNLFKTKYISSFTQDDNNFEYGFYNTFFKKCIDKTFQEIAKVTESLNITSQEKFVSYNETFSKDTKTSVKEIIDQHKVYNKLFEINSNKDILDIFKYKIFTSSKSLYGHAALAYMVKKNIISLNKIDYKIVNVWRNFFDSSYPDNYVDANTIVSNYEDTYISPDFKTDIDPVTFEDINNFIFNIEHHYG